VNDTPRTDAAEYESQDEPITKLGSVDAEFARSLERELTTAQDRIKRLEEAGDALCAAAAFMGWHMEIEKWHKAKEAKL